MTTVMLIKPNSTIELVDPRDMSLEWLQGQVGGYIEMINGTGWSGYVNEDSKQEGQPINLLATELASRHGWPGAGCDVLCGPVLFMGPVEKGEHLSVPQPLIQAAINLADQIR